VKTNWLAIDEKSGRNSYVNLYPDELRVEVGSHYGRGITDNAGRCSYDEFLKGCFHDIIKDDLGVVVLEEVIQAVGGSSG